LISAIDPVFRNASRPAFLALVVSTLFIVTFFTRNRYRWFGLLAICALFVFLGTTNYAGFFDKLKELMSTISEEERVHIWSYSMEMLRDNSLPAWFFGNGIGSTYDVLQKYALPDPLYQSFSFPHNFFIQILFENGIIGSVLIFGGLSGVFYLLVVMSIKATDATMRLLIVCMMAVFLNCLMFTGLTVGFYSKYTLYPLGFIVGVALVLAEKLFIKEESRSIRATWACGR
jgi:O-antigen ligase